MKKIIVTVICLALCTLALVACDSENNVNNEISKYTGDGSFHVISKDDASNMPDMSHTLDHTAFVISGEEKITPKQFPGPVNVTVELDGGIYRSYLRRIDIVPAECEKHSVAPLVSPADHRQIKSFPAESCHIAFGGEFFQSRIQNP